MHFFYYCPEVGSCCGMFCLMQAIMWWASILTLMIKVTPCTLGKLTLSVPLNTVNWWSRLCYVSSDPNLADVQGWFYVLFNSKICEKDSHAKYWNLNSFCLSKAESLIANNVWVTVRQSLRTVDFLLCNYCLFTPDIMILNVSKHQYRQMAYMYIYTFYLYNHVKSYIFSS